MAVAAGWKSNSLGSSMDMKIVERLSREYDCDLTPLDHESKNLHFSGRSKRLNKDILVKLYDSKKRCSTELAILEVLQSPTLLGSYECGECRAVILEYCDMQDVTEMSMATACDYGILLGRFHKVATNERTQQIRELSGESSTLFARIDETIGRISSHPAYAKVLRIYHELSQFRAVYQQEYEALPKVVLHGDFGLRNIKLVENAPVLIDFERSKYDIAWMDLMKFFNREALDENLQARFLEGYQTQYPIAVPTPLLQKVLEFYTAIGVYSYTMHIPDQAFRLMGDRMIHQIDQFCADLQVSAQTL